MRRRKFIRLAVLTASAAPLQAFAQQVSRPIIGYLSSQAIDARPQLLPAFLKGLATEGFVKDRNVEIELRAADGRVEPLPELISDFVQRRVAVIFTGGPTAAVAAKRGTTTIPVVFVSGEDPVQLGLVSSINRPGGNITGVSFLANELVAKRLTLLHELLPRARRIAVLVNPINAALAEPTLRDATVAAVTMGIDTRTFNASSSGEIDEAFAALSSWRPDALFVGADPFFASHRLQLAALAARHALPSSYGNREYVEAGCLMSYGANFADSYLQAGVYVGRILKGDKPGELPVVQPTRFELMINLKTAKALGLDVPPTLLARADEVIE